MKPLLSLNFSFQVDDSSVWTRGNPWVEVPRMRGLSTTTACPTRHLSHVDVKVPMGGSISGA